MKHFFCAAFVIILVVGSLQASETPRFIAQEAQYRVLPVAEYRDKMKAGWIGQIAGVAWGAPTEFRWNTRIIPEADVPVWLPEMINDSFDQDDMYVELTFLRTLEEHGLDVCIRQAGIDFANSEYPLWHANVVARNNLRSGIAPPDSGHPYFNQCADDIDYQIQADFSGLISPGMPNMVIELGNTFGRLMNYGDGLYGGLFVGGMYTEAFFETDIRKIIEAGLACIPPDSQYAEMVRDVLQWYEENPDDWIATWHKIEEKYQRNPDYRRHSCSPGEFNIDAKINGAYILVGLLYGKGDLDQTIIISMRCGQDSDCNPSNAAGVLFTTLGFSQLPARFTEKLDYTTRFIYTEYNVAELVDVSEMLARQIVLREGGRIETDESGAEYFVIPVRAPIPPPLAQSWNPSPITGSLFTEEEMAQIRFRSFRTIEAAVAAILPGWTIKDCGPDMDPGKRNEFRGRQNVLMTHPLNREVPCTLARRVDIPEGKKTVLTMVVSNHPGHDWELVIRINGEVRGVVVIDDAFTNRGWAEIMFDLTSFAGRNILIELENRANGWSFEAGYWASLTIESTTD